MTKATAPGKVILFGEHAVVYGRPAIAAPVSQIRATAVVENSSSQGVRLLAPDLVADYMLAEAAEDDPLATAVRLVQTAAGLSQLPDLIITVRSDIPIAGGLGSGAATAAALIRALAQHLERADLARAESVSALTYQVEQIHHGTPSGIDNSVVAFERPIYFVRRQPHNQIETFAVAAPLRLLIADSGIGSATRLVVGDVRCRWQADPARFEQLFDGCGRIAQAARRAIEVGNASRLGVFMQENHSLLREMTVSLPELDHLVTAALTAGALGAKLSGAGRGGNVIALVTPESEVAVRAALLTAGARTVLNSTIAAGNQ